MRLSASLLALGGLLVATVSPAGAQEPPPAAEAVRPSPDAAAPTPALAPAPVVEPTPAPAPAPAPVAEPVAKPEAADAAEPQIREIIRDRDADYVQGTCATPFEAMLQLLYWIQEGTRVDRAQAAACLDPAGADSAEQLADLAWKLKTTLDVRGLYIDVPAIPKDPHFKDGGGISRWRLPDLDEVEIVKKGDKWLFSAATVKRIRALYEDAIPPTLERILNALPAWMHKKLGPMKIWQIIGVLLLLIVGFTLQKIVIHLVRTYVGRLAGRVNWVDSAASRIDRPIGGLAMAGVFYLAFPWLQFSIRLSQTARIATQVLAVFSFVWLGYRLIDVLCDWLAEKASATATKLDDQLVPMLRKVLKVLAVIIGGLFILQNVHVNVGSLMAGLGLGGLAFALAARDSIANIFGSLVIFIDKPFQIGDWVVIGSVEGIVEEVGWRTTRVRTFYNSAVTVPNAMMTNIAIDNYGMRRYRRYKATLGLTYDTPPEKIQAFCEGVRAIIARLPGMRKDYYMVEFREFGPTSLDIFLYCFMEVASWDEELRTRTNLNLEILRLAENLGVSFAFPTQTLHVETRARESDISSAPSLTNDQLTQVIDSFAEKGPLSRRDGVSLSRGYEPGSHQPKGGSDG